MTKSNDELKISDLPPEMIAATCAGLGIPVPSCIAESDPIIDAVRDPGAFPQVFPAWEAALRARFGDTYIDSIMDVWDAEFEYLGCCDETIYFDLFDQGPDYRPVLRVDLDSDAGWAAAAGERALQNMQQVDGWARVNLGDYDGYPFADLMPDGSLFGPVSLQVDCFNWIIGNAEGQWFLGTRTGRFNRETVAPYVYFQQASDLAHFVARWAPAGK